jgi:deazaflavin-dependent oxidoreductase (nitroreductase family)
VSALLRSPAHRLLSGSLILLTVTGRRTGRAHTFPVGYSQAGDTLTVAAQWPGRKQWWRNLRTEAPVAVRLRGTARTGRAVAVGNERDGVVVRIVLDPIG